MMEQETEGNGMGHGAGVGGDEVDSRLPAECFETGKQRKKKIRGGNERRPDKSC